MKLSRRLKLACCLLLALPAAHAGDATPFWFEGDVRVWRQSSLQSDLGWKLSFDELFGDLGSWELKPKLQASIHPWLETAATYKLTYGRSAIRGWSTSHGLELDLKTKARLREGLNFHTTHRLAAVLPPTGIDDLNYRVHLIPAFTWPASWLPHQIAAETSLEAIWGASDSAWIETKLVPIRMKFAAGDSLNWSLFYLLNDKRQGQSSEWQRAHVIVLAINLNFR